MLLPEMENKRDSLVVVIAGYRKQMDDLMAHNEGLPSRFPHHFTFEDYSDSELLEILMSIVKENPKFKLSDEKYARIAIKRLGRQRGSVGFGNARAVKNLFQNTLSAQASRIIEEENDGVIPDHFMIKRDDLLGPKCIDRKTCPALVELHNMKGLKNVKQTIEQLLNLVQTNTELEEVEKPIHNVTLNRIFLGNPGTGKTTVAKLYGEILKSLGMLSKGDVIVKNPQDFVGKVLGESEDKTKTILDNAKGCVLVIDEAYGLNSSKKSNDPYKVAVIDTIVAEVGT
jgi:SpoVK/Ycf46/Vps4 family AAA+-type ATPase